MMRTNIWRKLSLSLSLLACTSLLTGCPPEDEGTRGLEGRVTFFCGYFCSVQNLVLAAGGATFRLQYQSPRKVAYTQVLSSDVLDVSVLNDEVLEVRTGRPGVGEFILGANGQLLDRLRLRVEPVTEVVLDRAVPNEPLLLWSDAYLELKASWRGDSGPLFGANAVRAISTGSLRLDPDGGDDTSSRFVVTGTRGAGTIEFDSSDARLSLPIQVVGPQDLVRLESTVVSENTLSDGSLRAEYRVQARTAQGAVYGVPCDWRVSDAAVQFTGGYNPTYDLKEVPGHVATFVVRPGTHAATCYVGDLSVTIPFEL